MIFNKEFDFMLKPCPFCGSKAKLEQGGFGEIFARCSNANCGINFDGGIWFTTPQQAIDLWNKRIDCIPTPNCSLQAEITQLKEEKKTLLDFIEATTKTIENLNQVNRAYITEHYLAVPTEDCYDIKPLFGTNALNLLKAFSLYFSKEKPNENKQR